VGDPISIALLGLAGLAASPCKAQDYWISEGKEYWRYESELGISVDIPVGISVEEMGDFFYVPTQCGPEQVWLSFGVRQDEEVGEVSSEAEFLALVSNQIAAVDRSGRSQIDYLSGDIVNKLDLTCVHSIYQETWHRSPVVWVNEHHLCVDEIGSNRAYMFLWKYPDIDGELQRWMKEVGRHSISSVATDAR
jgi:hypothetical protein